MTSFTTATAELVADPANNSIDLSAEIDSLVALQAQISKLEVVQREMRARVREAMNRFGLGKFTSQTGHCATVVLTNRTSIDAKRAAEVLSPSLLSEITTITTSSVLRVR